MPRTIAIVTLAGLAVGVSAQSCDIDMIFPSVATDLPVFPSTLIDIEPVDLNGDGALELVVAVGAEGPTVFMNDGTGNFTGQPAAPGGVVGGGSGLEAEVGLFDGDDIPDLAITRSVASGFEIVIFRGVGDGTFEPAPIRTLVGNPAFFEAVDIEADGDTDFVARTSNREVVVYRNNGDLTFSASVPVAVPFGDIFIAKDLNGDGLAEIILANFESVTILDNLGNGAFTTPRTFSLVGSVFDLVVADFNSDGHRDLAFAANGPGTGTDSLFILFNDGAGNFQQTPAGFAITGIPSEPQPSALAAIDVDGDTDTDIVASTTTLEGPGIIVYRNDGNGDFTDQSSGLFQPTWLASAEQAGGADLDGDGSIDLLSIFNNGQISITRNHCSSAPIITDQPSPAIADAGSTAFFSVGLDAVGPTTTFQWRFNGAPLADGGRVTGTTTADLTITSINADDQGFYDCVVTTIGGSRRSDQALLAVSGGGGVGDCPADLVAPFGLTDLSDVDAFIQSFLAGCP